MKLYIHCLHVHKLLQIPHKLYAEKWLGQEPGSNTSSSLINGTLDKNEQRRLYKTNNTCNKWYFELKHTGILYSFIQIFTEVTIQNSHYIYSNILLDTCTGKNNSTELLMSNKVGDTRRGILGHSSTLNQYCVDVWPVVLLSVLSMAKSQPLSGGNQMLNWNPRN